MRGLGAAVAVAALVTVTACGTTVVGSGEPVVAPEPAQRSRVDPSPTPTPTPTPPEQVVELPGPQMDAPMAAGTSHIVIDSYSWRTTGTGDRSKPPEERYLVLRMTISATQGTVPVNPLYFKVRLPDGTMAEPTMGADGNEPLLGSAELAMGEKIDGVVTFDIPPENTILVVENELGEAVGAVTIPAPR